MLRNAKQHMLGQYRPRAVCSAAIIVLQAVWVFMAGRLYAGLREPAAIAQPS